MSQNLTNLNGMRCSLASSITDIATSITLNAADAPYQEPPDPGSNFYYLTLIDYTNRPGAWERVKVTARTGAGPYILTVTRNIDSSTGAGIAFSAGAVIQWVPGVEEITPRAKFVLSAGADATSPFRLDPTTSTPQYLPVDGFYSNAVDTTGDESRWYNNTGNPLTLSQLLVYSYDHSNVGDITFEVFIDGSAAGITVTILAADAASIVKRDTTNSAVLNDGSYMYVKATNTVATETGRLYVARIALLAEE